MPVAHGQWRTPKTLQTKTPRFTLALCPSGTCSAKRTGQSQVFSNVFIHCFGGNLDIGMTVVSCVHCSDSNEQRTDHTNLIDSGVLHAYTCDF